MITRTVLAAILIASGGMASAPAQDLPLRINGREHVIANGSAIQIDGQSATLADLRALPDGLQIEWSPSGAANRGGLPVPVFSYTLVGPVTSNSPLEVLGQAITLTASTTLANLGDPLALPQGTPMVVAGLVDANGSVLATLVERRTQAGNRFLLTGPVLASNPAAGTLTVGRQAVAAPGVAFPGCAGPWPALGEFVSLRAAAVSPWVPGTTLQGVSAARCVSLVPAGSPGATGFLQGLLTAVPAAQRFDIGMLAIQWDAQTRFVAGAADDLAPGVAVSVDGSYVDASHFAASVVEFLHPAARFEAPLQPSDVQAGAWLRPFGVQVRASAQVRDEDGVLANGLAQSRQVEVRGYVDRLGHAYATRVRDRGGADPADVRLRGPVAQFSAPDVYILGLKVDTTGATFADELGAPMTAAAFFAALQIGHEVDVSGASWSPASATLSGGLVTFIGAEPVPPPPAQRAAAAVSAGTASGYSLVSPLFVDGFDN